MNDKENERYGAFREYIKHPENFHVAKPQKATLETLKKSGYHTTKKGALIPLNTVDGSKFDSAKIVKGKIVYTGKTKDGKKITEKVTPVSAPDFHDALLAASKKKLKKNQMLTVKIGDNASFSSRFQNYADLFRYITQDFKPKGTVNGKKVTAKYLLRYISLVEVENATTKKPQPKRKNRKAKK